MNTHNFRGIVADDTMLSNICASFAKAEIIGLDTEYVRESTYYPEPSLVQISDGNIHVLVDVKLLQNLQPLKKLFATPEITKIIHSSEQDLMVLECIACPIESSLYDTQLAAAFLGFGYMIGYQTLVKTCLGIQLKKGYARSDWLARPLSKAQINYAIEDVAYLHELRHFLTQRLRETGKVDWFAEESKRMLEDYYNNCFERSVPRVTGEGKLVSSYEKSRLKKLVEWREAKAREANLPRRWMIKDKYLIAVAQNQKPISQLIDICKGNLGNNFNIDADEIKKELKSIKREAHNTRPLSGEDKRLIEGIKQIVSQAAKEHKIEQSLIASHRQILRYVKNRKNRDDMALSSGWRYQIIKQPIERLGAGRDA